METLTIAIAFCFVVAVAVMILMRTERVGELTVPVRSTGMTTSMRISVRREPLPRDDAAVHIGYSVAAYHNLRELHSREALQIASWLEMGCERSGDLGSLPGFEVSSIYERDRLVIQLTLHDRRDSPMHARLTPVQARQVAQWLRLAASPGRTLADARRRMPKAPA